MSDQDVYRQIGQGFLSAMEREWRRLMDARRGTHALQAALSRMAQHLGPESTAEAEQSLAEIQAMCRTLSQLGLGPLRAMAPAACAVLEAIASEPPVQPAPRQLQPTKEET